MTRLLGVAVGGMGMSRRDFEGLTPEEFAAAWGAWREREDGLERGRWERTRLECVCLLQPYSRETLRGRDVMRFPWDEDGEEDAQSAPSSAPGVDGESREDVMERYRRAREAYGLK